MTHIEPLGLRDLGKVVTLGPGLVVPLVVWHEWSELKAQWPALTTRHVARVERLCARYPEAMRAIHRAWSPERRR